MTLRRDNTPLTIYSKNAKYKANVDLLHIVKDNKDKAKATAKFEKIIANIKDKPQDVEISFHIKSGSIYTDIASKASDGASFAASRASCPKLDASSI